MNNFLKFNRFYFAIAAAIFCIEILIARYAHDQIIRPYIGDLLVVMLIYCFVKSFLNAPVFITALYVLLFSYAVEISQYFHLVTRLGLQHSGIAKTIMGTSFAWIDMAAYTIGIVIIVLLEKKVSVTKLKRASKIYKIE